MFTGNSVQIDNVSAVKSAGTVVIDGTTYYAYEATASGAPNGLHVASVGVLEQLTAQLHHGAHLADALI